ncbi:MAG: bifunctional phosphopantothenoylcysteine decarboxylase/phosphopantothenate--cysteine ligase CoaBC [Nitrospinae bacterium]|nr:bifunctional phosphopantothenoylcysteine decarboxylase/phosphopantothenate--cysteine ligase CoaBC [Nitrospinota bacterium]
MKVILGVTGGVAAYKAADLARRLMDLGLGVKVVMTANAEKFVTPLTFEALTGSPVIRAGLPEPGEEPMPHITLGRECSMMIVAPATANIIGKMANGVADDMLSTLLTACGLPVLMAPAMNTKMWQNQPVQDNIEKLKSRGVTVIGPCSGLLACGDEGEGKMAPVEEITAAVADRLGIHRDMIGIKVVVTAGGTREPIDAVRYIGNRSSGKMGVALAREAALRGADVTLIAAAMEACAPDGVNVVKVETAIQMQKAVHIAFEEAHILVMAAAVGDYRVEEVPDKKVKSMEHWQVNLTPNPDILAGAGQRKGDRMTVGFAAETERALEYGREKLAEKNLDMIVVNDVSRRDIGFGSDFNEVTIINKDGVTANIGRDLKENVARKIFDEIMSLRSVKVKG